MSEKVTFRELIESIAKETDNSKQFTHDFLKDFVDVINDGLEQDKKVNIAGFGKFQLRRMDEREGYNPQTEEKITIPAHNKIVFKPYKDLRELVNAPYAHLEPELIEEDSTSADDSAESEEPNTSDNNTDDFIPEASPTSYHFTNKTEDKEKAPFDLDDNQDEKLSVSDPDATKKESGEDQRTENPFAPDEDLSISEQDEDVVEFNTNRESQAEKPHSEEKPLDDFINPIEPSTPEDTEFSDKQADNPPDLSTEQEQTEIFDEEESSKEDEHESDEYYSDPFAETFEGDDEEQKVIKGEEAAISEEDSLVEETLDQAEDLIHESDELLKSIENEKKEEPKASPPLEENRNTRKRTSALPVIAIAALVLIALAGGAWYFGILDSNAPYMTFSETESSTDVISKHNNQDPSAGTKATADRTPNQNQSTNTSSSRTAAASDTKASSSNLQIQEGQTLWSIAEEKYGNPRLWPWIYGENGSLEDPDLILAGKSLSVPLPSGPQNSLNFSDSVGVAKGFIATYNWFRDSDRMKAKNHLWAAKSYHENIRNLTDVNIDKADLSYANQAR